MRQFIRRRAAQYGLDSGEVFRAQVVATEAVTNAIRHGTSRGSDTPIRVTCFWRDGGLAIEVGDRGRFRRHHGRRAPLAESGRGLGLIERLTQEFALETGDGGTRLKMLLGQAA